MSANPTPPLRTQNTLRNSVRELLVQKFTLGDTSILKNLGFLCRSVEDLKVDKYDDKLLHLLREEMQNPGPVLNTSLRMTLLRARFSDTIDSKAGGSDVAECSRKRKRVDEILDTERKKRREEGELRSIELQLLKQKEDQQKLKEKLERQKVIAQMRAAARAELEEMEQEVMDEKVNWPEDNFRAMRDFELLIRGGSC